MRLDVAMGEGTAGVTGTRCWDQWLLGLPEHARVRFEALLRRSLKRRLGHMNGPTAIEVPESVRSEAVGMWRRTYMRGSSKAAARRMNYTRLRKERTYQEIERRLLAKYQRRHEASQAQANAHVDDLTFEELCEAYRATHPQLAGSALEGLAREACLAAYRDAVRVDAVLERMADRILAKVRSDSLDDCATVYDADPASPGRFRKRPFHLEDVATDEQVADRVRDVRLVDGVARACYGGRSVNAVACALLAAQARNQPEVLAFGRLLSALFGEQDCATGMLERLARGDAKTIAAQLHGMAFAQRVAQELLRNPIYGVQYQRSVELRLRVRQSVPQTPMEAYPLARTMRRQFVLHVGPTNSGKTHDALQALREAESGAYLGPLRLLAYEQFQRLNREGCPCSLLTGEEASDVAGARHVASTVEMADFQTAIDVAVIDEAQMIADADRGQHWTAAILGIPAARVHVCCAPHAEQVVRQLVDLCGDDLEVVRHERLVPLMPDRGGFHLPGSVEPGDALVVFSRKAVHAVAAEVSSRGLRPSLVYGALPHDVRHEEARRFDEGETDVVVATDAIGMGMNLPIRRIVFVEQKKFDGRDLRMLRPEEVQQIAGRAGRFGRYDVGLYQSTRLRKEVFRLYGEPVPSIASIPVGIPENIALVRDVTLTDSIIRWTRLEQPAPFRRVDVRRDLALIAEVEARLDAGRQTDIPSKLKALSLATMPFDETDRRLYHAWLEMVEAELAGEEALLPVPEEPMGHVRLVDLESDYRYCDLLYTYARTFGHDGRLAMLTERRVQISRVIMGILAGG